MSQTDASVVTTTLDRLRRVYQSGRTRSLAWRIKQLKGIGNLVEQNSSELAAALKQDLGVSESFAQMIELESVRGELTDALENLNDWMKQVPYSTPLVNQPGQSLCVPEPYGVALIISPWNYPISLVLNPIIAAVAAGNCILVKPSEVSMHVTATLARLIPKYLDPDCVSVMEGDALMTSEILKHRFDVIFYTGNTEVGKIVMRAASNHLTPVTLELGGKNPTIVAADCNISVACRRIAWGKFSMNAGQTCVSPDYVLVDHRIMDVFVKTMKQTIDKFYGTDPKKSTDFSRIINEKHCQRLASLLEDPTIQIVHGGQVDVLNKYVSPTVAIVRPESKLMEGEVFGPILCVLPMNNLEEAINYINGREKPLALYLFSSSKIIQHEVLEKTSSGGVGINDTIMQIGGKLPFGGVGSSGMGAYHGKAGFDAFSHLKPVYRTGTFLDPSVRYPPYTPSKQKQIAMLRSLKVANALPYIAGAVVLFGGVIRSNL
eukprot:TRINITY_DN11518_c0_g1_i1.p1 TRINITY_DN11518_c0_g1~~TRINITY_DN11518_c0_g1_i1.p1  ORF type:complete len:489 (+),score=96.52 TRINITY_DN11518_c0_g1_i1:51-1517(+)